MIHVFHGFLGSPADFSFLHGNSIRCHDLYETYDEPEIRPEDTLIGYSMGGRIALELASQKNFNIKKLVLINAHPGLETEEERLERKSFESKILERLTSQSSVEFLSWWNALPIFQHDGAISVSDDRFKKSAALFSTHLLSEQQFFLPELQSNRDKVVFIVGLQDEKYLQMAEEKIVPLDIPVRKINGGHRLFQKKDELMKVLSEEGIL